MSWRLAGACAIALCATVSARAQTLPSEPIVVADGHVTIGGEISASIAPEDTGFFNYTDYEHSSLRTMRLSLVTSVNAGDRLALLAEIRSENGERPEPYGLYLRVRPWPTKTLDIQVGRIPPTFGAFPRRAYAADNPLISYPLAYQYLTSVRPDALPASADELLRMRGRGWLTVYTVGNPAPDRGVPITSSFHWDTGVQVHAANDSVEGTIAVTGGTLSNPGLSDGNGGRQLAGRVLSRPVTGLAIGGSVARGPFVNQSALDAANAGGRSGDFTQTAWGADVEYSRDYYLLRFESIVNRWILPVAASPDGELAVDTLSTSVEGRYKIRPGLYAAARLDHLGFSEIAGATTRGTWEAPVTRVVLGGGVSVQRNLLVKMEYQYNTRDGGRVQRLHLGAAQLVFWF